MLNTTVREEWNSFEEKCLSDHSQQSVHNSKLVFYASYHAALLQVIVLLKTNADVDSMLMLEKECEQFWRDQHVPLQQETVELLDSLESDGGTQD